MTPAKNGSRLFESCVEKVDPDRGTPRRLGLGPSATYAQPIHHATEAIHVLSAQWRQERLATKPVGRAPAADVAVVGATLRTCRMAADAAGSGCFYVVSPDCLHLPVLGRRSSPAGRQRPIMFNRSLGTRDREQKAARLPIKAERFHSGVLRAWYRPRCR